MKKSLEESKIFPEQKRHNGQGKMLHKKTLVFNYCFKVGSRAIKHTSHILNGVGTFQDSQVLIHQILAQWSESVNLRIRCRSLKKNRDETLAQFEEGQAVNELYERGII